MLFDPKIVSINDLMSNPFEPVPAGRCTSCGHCKGFADVVCQAPAVCDKGIHFVRIFLLWRIQEGSKTCLFGMGWKTFGCSSSSSRYASRPRRSAWGHSPSLSLFSKICSDKHPNALKLRRASAKKPCLGQRKSKRKRPKHRATWVLRDT